LSFWRLVVSILGTSPLYRQQLGGKTMTPDLSARVY
jgi:hypothetical protein